MDAYDAISTCNQGDWALQPWRTFSLDAFPLPAVAPEVLLVLLLLVAAFFALPLGLPIAAAAAAPRVAAAAPYANGHPGSPTAADRLSNPAH